MGVGPVGLWFCGWGWGGLRGVHVQFHAHAHVHGRACIRACVHAQEKAAEEKAAEEMTEQSPKQTDWRLVAVLALAQHGHSSA